MIMYDDQDTARRPPRRALFLAGLMRLLLLVGAFADRIAFAMRTGSGRGNGGGGSAR